MDAVRRKRRDLAQNIVIVLLALSALALFMQTQLYNLSPQSAASYFTQAPSETASATMTPEELTDVAAPVRVAVTGAYPYGRYGNLTLTTKSADFSALGTLLREALGSANAFTACTPDEFLTALSDVSIYYDFLSPLPLSLLAGLVGATSADGITARCLVISRVSGTAVRLYLWDGGDTYFYCNVATTVSNLTTAVGGYELGTAYFAYDDAEIDSHAAAVAPCSLFLLQSQDVPVLTAADPLSSTDWLLTALDFNPHTNSRYPESNGTEVVVESDRSLRIQSDGTVLYQSGSSPTIDIASAQGTLPTVQEAVLGAGTLLGSLTANFSSDAGLYLTGFEQSGETTVLRFGYHVDGLPIRFSDGGDAAEVTHTGCSITKLTLRFRQYAASGDRSLLLPLRQALAIAAGETGGEMSIGYADGGGSAVSAVWLLE